MSEHDSGKPQKLAVYQNSNEVALTTWVQLSRSFARIQRCVTVLISAYDLTMPQFDILATLRFNEGVTQQDLAGRLLVTKGNVCGVLHRLEAEGLVERRPDPDDGRANRLFLTQAGKRRVGMVLPDHDDLIAKIFGAWSRGELLSLRSTLESLEERAVA